MFGWVLITPLTEISQEHYSRRLLLPLIEFRVFVVSLP